MSLLTHARARTRVVTVASVAAISTLGALAATASADDFGPIGHLGRAEVFTETNAAAGNALLAFDRTADGRLVQVASVPTGGAGTGAGLGSQGPVAVAGDTVYAADAGSGDVTTLHNGFRHDVRVIDRDHVGGTPISVTARGSLVYVLDASGSGRIVGYRADFLGRLSQIPGSARPLSPGAAAPAQVQFSPDGRTIAVTEKGTSRIDTYKVGFDGRVGNPVVNASAGATPFGFAFDPAGRLIASEAGASTASSYRLAGNGTLGVISKSVPTQQGAACWVAITPNGRFAYTGNGGGSVTGFSIAADGALTRLQADGLSASSPGANELTISSDGRDLYVANPGSGTIAPFAINRDGSLAPLPVTSGLPAGIAGIAAS